MTGGKEGMRLDPAMIGADDRGFLLGDALFETVRVEDGVAVRLEAHLARLEAGAGRLGIGPPAGLRGRVRAAVPEGWSGALRITLSRGRGGMLDGEGAGSSTLALGLRPGLPDPTRPPLLTAVLEGWLHEGALTAGLKTASYLERIAALRRARVRGADEALLRDSGGRIVEGAAANLFALTSEGVLVAPGAGAGVLPGITRAILLEVAGREGVRVEDRGLEAAELAGVRELWVSSTLRGPAPVVRLEGRAIGGGEAGPLFSRLRAGWRAVVRDEVERGRGG